MAEAERHSIIKADNARLVEKMKYILIQYRTSKSLGVVSKAFSMARTMPYYLFF